MNHKNDADKQLAIIREILLHGDREQIQELQEKIRELQTIIDSREEIEQRVKPILDDRIAEIKNDFPIVFGQEVGQEVEKKLLLSNDLLLTAISPMMGKMIKRYIAQQFQELKESIDRSVKNNFSFKRYYHTFLARVFGVKSSELILSELDAFKPDIKDIFVIQKDSGLLMGSYSTTKMGDSGIFGGMLTAIKAFGEDVFRRAGDGGQELEMIEYNNYKIFLQSHHNYYFAVVLKGIISTTDRIELSGKLTEFAEAEKRLNLVNFDGENVQYISNQLSAFFT